MKDYVCVVCVCGFLSCSCKWKSTALGPHKHPSQLLFIFSFREELYSRTLAGSITTPPLLIVFYKQHSSIDPMWNVRHLGTYGTFVTLLPQCFSRSVAGHLFDDAANGSFLPLFYTLFFKKHCFAIPSWCLWAWSFKFFFDLLGGYFLNRLTLKWLRMFLPFFHIYVVSEVIPGVSSTTVERNRHSYLFCYWWNPSAGRALLGFVSNEQHIGCWIHLGIKEGFKELGSWGST